MAKPTNYRGIHITVTYAMGYDYYEISQINKGKKWNEKTLFDTLKEAKKYIDEHYDELIKNESKKSARKSIGESNDFYFEVVFYKDVAKAKEYVKEIYNEFLKKYGYSKNDITWKLTSKGIGFSSSSENIGFDLEDYILDHMYKYGDYEFETDYELMESKKSARKSIKESTNIFDTLENAWDKSTMNNNVFEKTVLKLKTNSFKDPFDKYSTIYMFADGSSIDCDSLNPFDCEWCTYVSEDLSFVHEFKK